MTSDEQYREYLYTHIKNVKKAFNWLCHNVPEVFENFTESEFNELKHNIEEHDTSKYSEIEFEPYKEHWFETDGSEDSDEYNRAWLHHLHENPHHWQHWVIPAHDEKEIKVLSIPNSVIIEMICDWWSFSWKADNLYEIFDWYDNNKKEMIMTDSTRKTVKFVLETIKAELDRQAEDRGDLIYAV